MDETSNKADVSIQLETQDELLTQTEANDACMSRTLEAHGQILSTQSEANRVSSQLEKEEEDEPMDVTSKGVEVSTQLEVHGEGIPSQVSAQVSTQLKEQEVHKSTQVIPEKTDVSWTKDCDMKEQESQDEAPVVKHPKNEEMSAEPLFSKAQWNSFKLAAGCLYRVWKGKGGYCSRSLVVVRNERSPKVCYEIRKGPSEEHIRITETLGKLRNQFCWVGCCQSMRDCIANEMSSSKRHGQMKQYSLGTPLEQFAMVVAGQLSTSKSGNRSGLMARTEKYPVLSQETDEMVDVDIKSWEMCQKQSVRKIFEAASHPRSDIMVERFIRNLEEHFRKLVDRYRHRYRGSPYIHVPGINGVDHCEYNFWLRNDLKFSINANGERNVKEDDSVLEDELGEEMLSVWFWKYV
ncbi:uncharacterized protein LOC128921366 [Zeugodacus cucurbitae]|uniref:uncharacterized protein LOC128921366 n=1 Tax=Zeugodacus cucurbitae TaxID=28588 RepID=UPI0023D96EF1|nr:uncharacterized protein LOC128921366 [Zeugodacus cucurbitae]